MRLEQRLKRINEKWKLEAAINCFMTNISVSYSIVDANIILEKMGKINHTVKHPEVNMP